MAAVPTGARAGTLDLSGSVRARYEALDGQSRAGFTRSEDLLSLRTILTGEYQADGFRIGAELFDSRVEGIDAGSVTGTGEVNTLELVQAYVAADFANVLGKGSKASVQLGRMTLNIGSRRLVAADDYRNTTNGYTGVRADARLAGGAKVTAFYTLPQVRLPDDAGSLRSGRVKIDRESTDLQLWGVIAERPRTVGRAMVEIGYVGLEERDAPGRPTRDRSLHTLSARVMADPAPGRWDVEVEGIYQFGSASGSLSSAERRLDVAAHFLHADIGYSFPGPLKARLSVEYDRASGDGPGGRIGRFDTLFGMRRADLAPAGIYAQIGRANISTPGVRLEIAPGKRVDAFMTYRGMWLANRFDAFSTTGVRDVRGMSGSFAGHQFDGRVRWWLVPSRLRAEVNAAWLLKGRFLRNAPNAPRTGDTRYGSVAVTAVF
ncbi:MAG: alginate export family protein [Sphingobium sp.]